MLFYINLNGTNEFVELYIHTQVFCRLLNRKATEAQNKKQRRTCVYCMHHDIHQITE